MDDIGNQAGKKNNADSKEIQGHSPMSEGMEETRTYLKTNRVNKENKTKLFKKMKKFSIRSKTKVTKEDSHKKNPRRTKRNTLDLHLTQTKTSSDYKGKKQQGMSYACAKNKIFHSIVHQVKLPPSLG
jgi:hypothetical protein